MAKKPGVPRFLGGVTDRGGRPVWQLVVGTLVAMALIAAGITAATAGAYMLYVICITAYTCGIIHLYTTELWCVRSDVWAFTQFTYTTVLWCV